MATDFRINTDSRNAAVDAITALIDGGAGPGRIEIRTGSPPAALTDASSGTLLASLTFQIPAFFPAAGGVASADVIDPDTNADASGVAGYFRIYPGGAADTAAVSQGTCGVSSANLLFDNPNIVAGGTVEISAMTLSVPIGE